MMKKRKVFLLIILMTGIAFIITVYLFFQGLPWKKVAVAKELEHYLDKKYEQEFILKEKYYNFKDGRYGGIFYLKNEPSLEFNADEGYSENKYEDTFPGVVWAEQLNEDIDAFYKDIYPEIHLFDTDYVIDTKIDMVKGPYIPRYDTVDALLSVSFTINKPFADSDKEWKQHASLLQELQRRSKEIDTSFNYIDDEKKIETFITCPTKTDGKINTVEDAKQKCDVNHFDLEPTEYIE